MEPPVIDAQNRILDEITSGPGYCFLQLNPQDLQTLRNMVVCQWLSVIEGAAPHTVQKFQKDGIDQYHKNSHLLSHGTLWTKLNRILPLSDVQIIRQMTIIKTLESELDRFEISDEENVGREEIYWRLVRPQAPSDI